MSLLMERVVSPSVSYGEVSLILKDVQVQTK